MLAPTQISLPLGIDAINAAVTQLDDATQQHAALVEQSAATAQSLSGQANVLDEAVRLFTLPKWSIKHSAKNV
jgi:aerotaxis receptor